MAVASPLHTADSLGVAGHGKEASPGLCIPHLKPRAVKDDNWLIKS